MDNLLISCAFGLLLGVPFGMAIYEIDASRRRSKYKEMITVIGGGGGGNLDHYYECLGGHGERRVKGGAGPGGFSTPGGSGGDGSGPLKVIPNGGCGGGEIGPTSGIPHIGDGLKQCGGPGRPEGTVIKYYFGPDKKPKKKKKSSKKRRKPRSRK